MGGNGVLPGKRDLTMNKTKMAWASAALALALLLPAAGVKAYSSENVSLPSPIVEYASYNKLREAVGFEPLFLPRIAGYKTEHFLFIGEGLGRCPLQRQSWRTADNPFFPSDRRESGYRYQWRLYRKVEGYRNSVDGCFRGKTFG